jgi:uncharacterized protein with HEPN domain
VIVKEHELPWTKLKGVRADGAAEYCGKEDKFVWLNGARNGETVLNFT